jgi:hypothetical protein
VLACWLIPKYPLQNSSFAQRDPSCHFKALRANLWFAALISFTILQHLIYWIKICLRKRKMAGVDLRSAVERDFYFCTIYSLFFRIFGLGSWFWAV